MPFADLAEGILGEFVEHTGALYDDVLRGEEVVREHRAAARQVSRALKAVADPAWLERRRKWNRESARRRRARERTERKPTRPQRKPNTTIVGSAAKRKARRAQQKEKVS